MSHSNVLASSAARRVVCLCYQNEHNTLKHQTTVT